MLTLTLVSLVARRIEMFIAASEATDVPKRFEACPQTRCTLRSRPLQ
jgi:hypothetical protein